MPKTQLRAPIRSVRDVLGYTFVTMIVSGLIFSSGLSVVAIASWTDVVCVLRGVLSATRGA